VAKESQADAIANLARSINFDARLPHRVFTEKYAEVYVADWRYLIHRLTVNVSKVLMEQEGSSVVALGRFDKPRTGPQDWREDVFFISTSTEPDDYQSFLRRNLAEFAPNRATPETREPWVFAQRIGACSDLGTWCVYGELCAEIAVLGFRARLSDLQAARLYNEFHIEKLADALKRDTFFGDPGNEHSERQRAILRSAYLP
jgi:hypothetical protein